MNPRFIAHALADAMRDRVIQAHAYLAELEALEQAGIPVEIARDAVDRKPLETPATRAVAAWDGRGPLVLHGARDTGKSHAAALWARRRRRDGRKTVWLSCVTLLGFEALDESLYRTKRAPAVVLDELGAGLGGTKGAQTKIAAWLQDRAQRPTLITSNANTAQVESYLGARLVSRMKQAGELVCFEREAGLRERETEADPDTGRSPRWKRERWLVDRLGYEPVDHFDPEDNRVVHGCRVGDGIDGAPLDELEALAIRFALSWHTLCERGAELEAGQLDLSAQLTSSIAATVAGANARAEALCRIQARAANDLRAAQLADSRRGISTVELTERPSLTRDQLTRLGFRVRGLGDGVVVKRRTSKAGDELTMSPKLATKELAWDYAARLCAL